MNRFEKIARNIEADLILSDKDKAVIDAFTDGKEADSKKLSTDGKTLDGNWMGGKEIAIRDSEGVITPGEGRPHVKSDEVVLRALKKMTPSRYYRGSAKVASISGVADGIEALRKKYEPTSEEALVLGVLRDMAVHYKRGNTSRIKELAIELVEMMKGNFDEPLRY